MGDLARLLLLSGLFALGAWIHLEFEAGSMRAARAAVMTLLGLLVLLFLTGLTVRSAGGHRFVAHFFVGTAWVLIPFAMGVGVAAAIRSRDRSRVLQVIALVVAMGATVAAANTGYLGRLSDRTLDMLRFRLIHQLLTPGVLAASLLAWIRLSPAGRDAS